MLIIAALAAISSHAASEFSAGAGAMDTPDFPQSSYSWQIEYRRHVTPRASWSVAWINEGHIPRHHRDGIVSQLWLRQPIGNDRLSFAFGGGAYWMFDTQAQPDGDSHNVHAWAPVGSLSLTHQLSAPWFWRLSLNFIRPPSGFADNTAVLMFGRRLEADPPANSGEVPAAAFSEANEELTFFAGKTVVNAKLGRRAFAWAVEYRRRFLSFAEWSVGWIDEGDSDVTRRYGATAQLWLAETTHAGQFHVALGGGIHVRKDSRAGHTKAEPLVSPSIGYRFTDDWLARFTWHRVVSDYHRDADVFLLGFSRTSR